MISIHLDYISSIIIIFFYVIGFLLALYAVFQSRTPQGTMAWILALVGFPFLSIPAFFFFGKKMIEDYENFEDDLSTTRKKMENEIVDFKISRDTEFLNKFMSITDGDFLTGNSLKLLLDGHETYNEMIKAINSAKKYIFLEMYIFRTDRIGTLFVQALKERARAGVQVFVLYERLGIKMSKKILSDMKKSGINLGEFTPVRLNKLQMNFRNHRKLLIVDGKSGFFGGVNIGDDYLGRYPSIGFWRDSNVVVSGPIVNLAQVDFIKDWTFSQTNKINLELSVANAQGNSRVLLVNSGPSHEKPFNLLLHIEFINSAKSRLWVANPYIVPPQGIIDALMLAQIKGVDVRILIPKKSDNWFVALAMNVYIERLVCAGIRVYRYSPGMMHQKVMLIDDKIGAIGSSNLDFRSMHINFENTIITDDLEFIKSLDFAIRKDFEQSEEVNKGEFNLLPFKKKLASHLANSFAPIL